MKKQIIYTLLLFLFGHVSSAQENNKWNMGFGFGIFQAPFMKGEGIEDRYFDIYYSFGIQLQKTYIRKSKFALAFGLNFKDSQNKFKFTTIYTDSTISMQDVLNIKTHRKYLILSADYRYYFHPKSTFFIGTGLDVFTLILKRHPIEYNSQIFPKWNYFVDDYSLSKCFTPYFFFGKDIPFSGNIHLNIQFQVGMLLNEHKNVLIDTSNILYSPRVSGGKQGFLSSSILITINF